MFTKEDIGKIIILKSLGMQGCIFNVIEDEVWYKELNSGASCLIYPEDYSNWQLKGDEMESIGE